MFSTWHDDHDRYGRLSTDILGIGKAAGLDGFDHDTADGGSSGSHAGSHPSTPERKDPVCRHGTWATRSQVPVTAPGGTGVRCDGHQRLYGRRLGRARPPPQAGESRADVVGHLVWLGSNEAGESSKVAV